MRRQMRLRLSRNAVHVTFGANGSTTWEARSQYDTPVELSELVGALRNESALGKCRHVLVEVDRDLCQVRTLRDVPPMRRSDLAAVVSTEPARYFRRRKGPLIVDADWNHPPGDEPTATAVALEEPVVLAVLDGAAAAGFEVTAVRPADDSLPASISLLPLAEQRRRQRRRWMAVLRGAGLAAGVWGAAAAVYAVDLKRDRDAIAEEIARLADPIAQLDAARAEMRPVAVMLDAVTPTAAAHGWATELLTSLTAVIPASAYLVELSVEAGRGGRIEGWADEPRAVVDGLASLGLIANPRLLPAGASAAHFPTETRERFTVVFESLSSDDALNVVQDLSTTDNLPGQVKP